MASSAPPQTSTLANSSSATASSSSSTGGGGGRVRRIGEYDIGSQRLGRGSFGSVLKGCHATLKFPVAVKVVDFSQTRNAMKEVNVLSKLKHPNLVHLYDQFKNAKYVFSVLEFCAGGSLRDALQRATVPYRRSQGEAGQHDDDGEGRKREGESTMVDSPLPIPLIEESVARRLSAELLDALCYLNSPSVKLMHRDLKPANILLTDEDLSIAHVRVADLGFAQELRTEGHLLQSLIGTAMYMAPERLNGKPYDFQAEVWAAGLIIYELLFGDLPWNPTCFRELTEMVEGTPLVFPVPTGGRRGPGVSEAAKDLLRRMLNPNPAERITIEDARRHEWVADVPPLTEQETTRARPHPQQPSATPEPDVVLREDASVGTQTLVVVADGPDGVTTTGGAATNTTATLSGNSAVPPPPPPPRFSVNPMNDDIGFSLPTRGAGPPPLHHVDPRWTISPRTTGGATLLSSSGGGGARAGSSSSNAAGGGGRSAPGGQTQQSPPLGPTGTPPSGFFGSTLHDPQFAALPLPPASTVTNTSSLSTSTAARGVSPVPSAAPYAPVCPPARLMLEIARAVAWIAEEAADPAERVVLYCHAATVATSFDRSSPCARDIMLFCEECLAAARRHAVLIEEDEDRGDDDGDATENDEAAKTASPQYLLFEAICKNIFAMQHSDEFVALSAHQSDAFYLGTVALCEALVEDPESDAQIKDRAQQWIPQLQRKWDLMREGRCLA